MKAKSFGVIALLLLCSCLARSAPITGVTQSWKYDPARKVGTMHIVNVSHKIITAYVITYWGIRADGTPEQGSGSRLCEFLSAYLAMQSKIAQTPQYIFGAGEARDESIAGSSDDMFARVTVVAYEDGTVQSTDDRDLQVLTIHRKAQLLVMKKVNEVVQQTMADATIHDHQAAIVAELNRLATVYRNKHDDELVLEESSALALASQEVPQEKEAILGAAKVREQHIALLEQHVNLSGVQQ